MTALPPIKIAWSPRKLKRDEGATLKISLTVPKGYHINAYKPAEGQMVSAKISFGAAEGIWLSQPVYPKPRVLNASWSDVKILTYEGTIKIEVPVRASKKGKRVIETTFSYQGCTANACLPPGEQKFEIALEITG